MSPLVYLACTVRTWESGHFLMCLSLYCGMELALSLIQHPKIDMTPIHLESLSVGNKSHNSNSPVYRYTDTKVSGGRTVPRPLLLTKSQAWLRSCF